MTLWRFEHCPRLTSRQSESGGKVPFSLPDRDFAYVGSGKGGIAAILKYLRATGVLEHKMAPMFAPAWLGVAVYQQMQEFCFPSLSLDSGCRVVLIYHQYGFPQDMDRILDFAQSEKVEVIEDCAHAAESYYKGKRLGTIAPFSVFSFSKFVFCYALGGVGFADEDFGAFLRNLQADASILMTSCINGFKLVDEYHLARPSKRIGRLMQGVRRMLYARYGEGLRPGGRAIAAWEQQWQSELRCRRENYRYLRERFNSLGICDHLEGEDVTPYAVPLKVSEYLASRLVARLAEARIEAGIYRFDMNRFLVEPDFQPCVLIPVHDDGGRRKIDAIADIVRATI